MSQAPSTLGTMTTSSLSPISVTSVVRSSSTHGESSAFTRVQSAVSPRSTSLPTLTSPSRAASLRSTGTASSRLPSTMSAFAAVSGSLATIFSFDASKKWIIRDGFTGISVTGAGAPTASGLRKSRGLRKGRQIYRRAVRLVPSLTDESVAAATDKKDSMTDIATQHQLDTDQAAREASGAHAYGR